MYDSTDGKDWDTNHWTNVVISYNHNSTTTSTNVVYYSGQLYERINVPERDEPGYSVWIPPKGMKPIQIRCVEKKVPANCRTFRAAIVRKNPSMIFVN